MARNPSLDLVRFLCAFLVVCIHIGTPYYSYYSVFTTIAVPMFIILSGLLITKEDMRKHVNKSTPKIVQFIVWNTFLFAIVKSFQSW